MAAPAPERELRTQGQADRRPACSHAGLQVLGERGYQATRVDDVVRVADTSHGTFYLYFENKDALFRALAHTAADEMAALADELETGRPRRRRAPGAARPSSAGSPRPTSAMARSSGRWAENQVDDADADHPGPRHLRWHRRRARRPHDHG